MRSFRFPRAAIALMVVTFLTTLAAIGLAAEISRTVPAPMRFVFVFLFLWIVGAIGYGILFALRWTGVQRLSNVVTWHQPRK